MSGAQIIAVLKGRSTNDKLRTIGRSSPRKEYRVMMLLDLTPYKSQRHLDDLLASFPKAKKHYGRRDEIESPRSIGASGSMFRVFRGVTKPSVIYQEWAFAQSQSKEFERDVLLLNTQEQFENLHFRLGKSLARYWKNKAGQKLVLAHRYKLLDLFIKRACELRLPQPMMNDKLLTYGHVPLDRWVFITLDNIFSGIFLLTGRSMGQVKNEESYQFYQKLIRQLMRELKPPEEYPALYFEFHAWEPGRTKAR